MSADLLAAFGPDQSIYPDQHKDKQTSASDPASQVFQRPKPLNFDDAAPAFEERPLWEKDHAGADILFDAADEDGFGDFEDPEPVSSAATTVPRQQTLAGDLLGLDSLVPYTQPRQQDQSSAPRLPQDIDPFTIFADAGVPTSSPADAVQPVSAALGSDDDWGDFETTEFTDFELASTANGGPESTTRHTLPPDDTSEDDWEAFEDGPPSPRQSKGLTLASGVKIEAPTGSDTLHQSGSATEVNNTSSSERPTNIPPPSSLLQLLPNIIQSLSMEAKPNGESGHTLAIANKILQLYVTTSRIIAGRSHRWKRDTILAQSMRISFAGQKNSGMKLQSLDRSESVKEEQEALEVIAAWSRYSHALNAALSRAKLKKPAMSLSADMKIRTVTGPGILTSREPCAVCGLKRNERVLGIDVNADDVFGEFWLEFWGHRDCCEWWNQYKGLLKQR